MDSDGATGARGLSTLAPWSMAVNTYLKKRTKLGVKGELPPWVASPRGGEWGVILAIVLSALWEGFPMKITSFLTVRMYHLSSSGTMNAAAPEGTPPRRIGN